MNSSIELYLIYLYLLNNMEDIPPEFIEIVNEHFWELLA